MLINYTGTDISINGTIYPAKGATPKAIRFIQSLGMLEGVNVIDAPLMRWDGLPQAQADDIYIVEQLIAEDLVLGHRCDLAYPHIKDGKCVGLVAGTGLARKLGHAIATKDGRPVVKRESQESLTRRGWVD
mgnify:CR=1 FL=1